MKSLAFISLILILLAGCSPYHNRYKKCEQQLSASQQRVQILQSKIDQNDDSIKKYAQVITDSFESAAGEYESCKQLGIFTSFFCSKSEMARGKAALKAGFPASRSGYWDNTMFIAGVYSVIASVIASAVVILFFIIRRYFNQKTIRSMMDQAEARDAESKKRLEEAKTFEARAYASYQEKKSALEREIETLESDLENLRSQRAQEISKLEDAKAKAAAAQAEAQEAQHTAELAKAFKDLNLKGGTGKKTGKS